MKILDRARIVVREAVAAMALLAALWPWAAVAAERISFKGDVFPIIQANCLKCHQPGGEGYEKSELDLRTYDGLMTGTKFGPIVVPGDAFTSNLNVLVEGRADPRIRMPHKTGQLKPREIRVLRMWVDQGALNN